MRCLNAHKMIWLMNRGCGSRITGQSADGFSEGIRLRGWREVAITRFMLFPEGARLANLLEAITMDIPAISQKSRDLYEKSSRMWPGIREPLHLDMNTVLIVVQKWNAVLWPKGYSTCSGNPSHL